MIKVICAIIEENERILVIQRSENMKLPCKWEFPGGKIEEGETEEECILREIKEELNIEIKLAKRLAPTKHSYPSFSILLVPFIAKYIGGELKLAEHKTYIWLRKEELPKLDWADADISIVEEYLNQ